MPVASKQTKQADDRQTIPVTVEHTVGTVEVGGTGEPAITEAMHLIGAYEAKYEEGGVYRFGGTTIEVKHTRDGDGPNLAEWLQSYYPRILDAYRDQT